MKKGKEIRIQNIQLSKHNLFMKRERLARNTIDIACTCMYVVKA